ncbi:MAG TPA: ATP-binding protein [Candidatus Mcinerneyibacteriales bacterium]|jgi:anti-sigma regulatory factor (Ser/Thr protein kinase)|nr:ATP-binding protein [Candidatus Mcinerneyibacteriales bacterium]
MELLMEFEIKGGDFLNAGESSGVIKEYLKKIGLSPAFIRRVLIAAYEGELNVVAHAYQGTIAFYMDETKVKVVVRDKGPGIPDIDKAMEEGYSTASPEVREMGFGAGMGLPNMKRNSDEMEIASEIDKGTEVTMMFTIEKG